MHGENVGLCKSCAVLSIYRLCKAHRVHEVRSLLSWGVGLLVGGAPHRVTLLGPAGRELLRLGRPRLRAQRRVPHCAVGMGGYSAVEGEGEDKRVIWRREEN